MTENIINNQNNYINKWFSEWMSEGDVPEGDMLDINSSGAENI